MIPRRGLVGVGLRIQEEYGQEAAAAWFAGLDDDQRAAFRAEMDQIEAAVRDVAHAMTETLNGVAVRFQVAVTAVVEAIERAQVAIEDVHPA